MRKILITPPPDVVETTRRLLQDHPADTEIVVADTPQAFIDRFHNSGEYSLIIASLEILLEKNFDKILNIRQLHKEAPLILTARQVSLQAMRIAGVLASTEIIQVPVEEQTMRAILSKYYYPL